MTPYISVDLETTGLDQDSCQILEIGAVFENWRDPVDQLPTFRALVKHDLYTGQPIALAMNANILVEIGHDGGKSPTNAVRDFRYWISEQREAYGIGRTTVPVVFGGKNFAKFDLQFLRKVVGWNEINGVCHRAVDPTFHYWNPVEDREPPGSAECLKRAGIEKEVVHTAIEDARDVIRLVRHAKAPYLL